MISQFHSALRRHLAAYLDFRIALGFTTYKSSSNLSVPRAFDSYLVFRGVSSIDDVTEGIVHDWVHSVRQNSPATKNKYLYFARRFFDYLLRLGVTTVNPARQIFRLKVKAYRPYIFTIKEIHDILTAAEQTQNPSALYPQTLATLYHLIYACALRVSEGIKLRLRDVDFEQNTLSLWKTKFHKERLVPFSEPTARRLGVYLARRIKDNPPTDDQAPFFVHRGKQLRYRLVIKNFHHCLDTVGIKSRARLHDLRHTAAVHRLYKWYQDGHNPLNKLPLLSTFMGHHEIADTQVYLTISKDLLREGDKRFQASFEDVVRRRLPPDNMPR